MKISLKHLVLYPGCKRVSCGVSAFGQVFLLTQAKLGTRSFFSRLGLSWLQPSPDPETFYRTRVKTPVTPASVPLPLPLPLLTPATQASQGISFATIFKIHVTVCPVLFPCDLLKLTLRLRVETYLPFRHLRKQHKCCNLHSLCFMSL